jgi:hypothetical protein
MRRIVPLLVVAACPLAPLLVGCDDGAAPPSAGGTIAVGTLPAAPSAPSTAPSTAPPMARTDPVVTTPPPTTAPAATVLATELSGLVGGAPAPAPPSDVVVDDTRRLRLAVPQRWADRRTIPSPLPDGGEAPYLAAAPDQTAFLDGYGAPGLTAVVLTTPPGQALDAYTFADCTSEGRRPYRTDDLTGIYEAWRDCGEGGSAIVTAAVRQGRGDDTVLLLAQIVEPSDLAAVDQALASLRVSG